MLIGPDTTLAQVDAEIARCNGEAKRLPPASDAYVRAHVELNRLCRVRDAFARRDQAQDQANDEATRDG